MTHSLVEGLPCFSLRLARYQGAIHFRHWLRGTDGTFRREVDALPRSTLSDGHQRCRFARCAERFHQLHRVAQSLPGGVRGMDGENLIAALLDLELASGNDAMASHSQIRKSSKLMLQMLPGTDFIFSGYSSMPREDNLFGGGNFDAEDLDDYNVLQRDMQVDGGCGRSARQALPCGGAWPRPFKLFFVCSSYQPSPTLKWKQP